MRLGMLCILSALAAPASAKDPNTLVDRAADCMIVKDEARATILVSAVPASSGEDALIADAYPLLATCLKPNDLTAMAPRFTVLLGRIAEHLWKKRFVRVVSARQLAPKAQDDLQLAERGLDARKEWPQAVATIVCAADRDVMAKAALLQTGPGSAKEEKALAALVALIPPCLAAGERLKAAPSQIRAIVARAQFSNDFYSASPRSAMTAH